MLPPFVIVGARALYGLIANKLIAVYFGPEGVSVSQAAANILKASMFLSSAGTDQQLLRSKDLSRLNFLSKLLRLVSFYSLLFFVAILLFFATGVLPKAVTHDPVSFLAFSLCAYCSVLSILFTSYFKYFNESKALASYYFYSLLGASLLLGLSTLVGLSFSPALSAVMFSFVLSLFLAIRIFCDLRSIVGQPSRARLGAEFFREALGLASFGLAATACGIGQQMYLRYLSERAGDLLSAGLVDTLWKFSALHALVLSAPLQYCYLAKILQGGKHSFDALKKLIFSLCVLGCIGLVGYSLFAEWFVLILFSAEFATVGDTLLLLLMSDILRAMIAGMVFLVLARGLSKLLTIYEILMTVSFIVVASFTWSVGDLEGLVTMLLGFSIVGAAIMLLIVVKLQRGES